MGGGPGTVGLVKARATVGIIGIIGTLAIVAAVGPAAVALAVPALARWPWAMPALAGGLGLGILVFRPRAWGLGLLGTAMAILAAQLGGPARNLLDVTADLDADSWPTYDLTQEGFPPSSPDFVAVRGFFRPAWTLDEYGVPTGEHPDQAVPPRAVLVPMLGVGPGTRAETEAEAGAGAPDETVALDGAVVIARVAPGRAEQGGIQMVRGKTEPVPPDVLGTLVRLGPQLQPGDLDAVLVDSLATPARRDALVGTGLTLLCMLIAGVCMGGAVRTPRRT